MDKATAKRLEWFPRSDAFFTETMPVSVPASECM
jgi:hypothetical protein